MYVNVCTFMWCRYTFFALIKDVCVWFLVYLNDFSCVHRRRVISECADDTSFGNQPYKWANLINKRVIFHLKSYAITFCIKTFLFVCIVRLLSLVKHIFPPISNYKNYTFYSYTLKKKQIRNATNTIRFNNSTMKCNLFDVVQ